MSLYSLWAFQIFAFEIQSEVAKTFSLKIDDEIL